MTIEIEKNISLAPLTTFRIGGPADHFVAVGELAEFSAALRWAEEKGLPVFILGGGSNILVSDAGFRGLVIALKNDRIAIDGRRIIAGCGVAMVGLANRAADAGLTGLEWAAGLPGTLGGAIRGNAGSFGSMTGNNIESVSVYDRRTGDIKTMDRSECGFAYRTSIFISAPGSIVWEAVMAFAPDDPEAIRSRMAAVSKERRAIQPLAQPSAGSIFRNIDPAVLRRENPDLADRAAHDRADRDGRIGAGYIIDKSLDLKGFALGGAAVSPVHANFIVNTGHATADNVAALISLIKMRARNELGVALHEELEYVGF